MPATEVEKAIERCRAAYEANNITWDPWIASRSLTVLNHLADCWEARADGRNVSEGYLDYKDMKRACDAAMQANTRLLARCASTGSRVFGQVWREYHGS
jgi:hypothetical protein